MMVRLEINDIQFLDLENIFKPNLVVNKKLLYIEDDPNLQILYQNKFLLQQRFEFEKQHKEVAAMTDLEDLFDGQMTLESVNLCNDGSSSMNLVPKDDAVAISE